MSETLHLTVRFEDAGEGGVLVTIPEVPDAISQSSVMAGTIFADTRQPPGELVLP